MENVDRLLERAEEAFNSVMDCDDEEVRAARVDEGCKYMKHAEELAKIQYDDEYHLKSMNNQKEQSDREFEQAQKDKTKDYILKGLELGIGVLTIGVTIWSTCKKSSDELRNLQSVIEWEKTGSFSALASRTVAGNSLRSKK